MEKTPDTPDAPRQAADQDFEEVRQNMAASMSQDEADRKARIEYLRSLTGQKKPKKGGFWKKLLKLVLVLAAVAGLAFGVFWFFDKKADNNKQNGADNKAAQQETEQSVQPKQTVTKHYDSTALGLGFDYPEDWKVSESNGKITAVSPAGRFQATTGTVNAQVVFTIQSKQSTLPGFKNGNGIATRASEKIAYLKPTPNQRAQTHMTFVSNAGSATVGIDTIYITGDLGYQKDQAVPQTDIIQGDPLVSIFFAKCNGTTCAADPSTTKLTVADSAWNESNPLVKAAKATLTSLTIN